jgi:hypothetical protein
MTHYIATQIESRVGGRGQFSTFLQRYLEETNEHKAKIAPDLIVHKKGDISHFLFLGETKLILGTNYWEKKLNRVKSDLI